MGGGFPSVVERCGIWVQGCSRGGWRGGVGSGGTHSDSGGLCMSVVDCACVCHLWLKNVGRVQVRASGCRVQERGPGAGEGLGV